MATGLIQNNPQDDPFRFERETAIAVFNKRNVAALKALKKFLLNMSKPKAIETVLAQSVCRCAETHPETFDWIITQAEQLEPEICLERWVRRWVITRLEQQDRLLEREFSLEPGCKQLRLSLEESALQGLQENSSQGEWLLLNRLVEIELKG